MICEIICSFCHILYFEERKSKLSPLPMTLAGGGWQTQRK
jgi:hypothetical protein